MIGSFRLGHPAGDTILNDQNAPGPAHRLPAYLCTSATSLVSSTAIQCRSLSQMTRHDGRSRWTFSSILPTCSQYRCRGKWTTPGAYPRKVLDDLDDPDAEPGEFALPVISCPLFCLMTLFLPTPWLCQYHRANHPPDRFMFPKDSLVDIPDSRRENLTCAELQTASEINYALSLGEVTIGCVFLHRAAS